MDEEVLDSKRPMYISTRYSTSGMPGMDKNNPENIGEAINHNMLDHLENNGEAPIFDVLNSFLTKFPIRMPIKRPTTPSGS